MVPEVQDGVDRLEKELLKLGPQRLQSCVFSSFLFLFCLWVGSPYDKDHNIQGFIMGRFFSEMSSHMS